jgi:hypothetical protein
LEEDALAAPEVPYADDRGHTVDVMGRFVHERGFAAHEATDADARAEIFAGLIATCADCHADSRDR